MFKKLLNFFRRNKDERVRSKVTKRDELIGLHAGLSPEEICGIDPESMSADSIRDTLAKLYKRHNEAVSSLNPELRQEARLMLEAIVDCRKRYVDLR